MSYRALVYKSGVLPRLCDSAEQHASALADGWSNAPVTAAPVCASPLPEPVPVPLPAPDPVPEPPVAAPEPPAREPVVMPKRRGRPKKVMVSVV